VILAVTLNTAVDHLVHVNGLQLHDVNRVQRTEIDAGGKGVNVARVVAALGGEVCATGYVGGSAGQLVRSVLDLNKVAHDFVTTAGETRTNYQVEDGQGPPTQFNPLGPTINDLEWQALQAKLLHLAQGANWVAFGGSLPPGVPPDAYRVLAAIAQEAGARVLIDADGEAMRQALPVRPDFVKPNAQEAARLLGHPVAGVPDAVRAAVELRTRLAPGGTAVISLGKDGAVLACDAGTFRGISPEVEVRSTVGAGDSMLGAMLAQVQRGKDWPSALRWGLAAGAATATTDGTKIATGDLVAALWHEARVEAISA